LEHSSQGTEKKGRKRRRNFTNTRTATSARFDPNPANILARKGTGTFSKAKKEPVPYVGHAGVGEIVTRNAYSLREASHSRAGLPRLMAGNKVRSLFRSLRPPWLCGEATPNEIAGRCPGLSVSQGQVDITFPYRILSAQNGEWRLLFFVRLAIEPLIAGSQAADGTGFQLFGSGSKKQIPSQRYLKFCGRQADRKRLVLAQRTWFDKLTTLSNVEGQRTPRKIEKRDWRRGLCELSVPSIGLRTWLGATTFLNWFCETITWLAPNHGGSVW